MRYILLLLIGYALIISSNAQQSDINSDVTTITLNSTEYIITLYDKRTTLFKNTASDTIDTHLYLNNNENIECINKTSCNLGFEDNFDDIGRLDYKLKNNHNYDVTVVITIEKGFENNYSGMIIFRGLMFVFALVVIICFRSQIGKCCFIGCESCWSCWKHIFKLCITSCQNCYTRIQYRIYKKRHQKLLTETDIDLNKTDNDMYEL